MKKIIGKYTMTIAASSERVLLIIIHHLLNYKLQIILYLLFPSRT